VTIYTAGFFYPAVIAQTYNLLFFNTGRFRDEQGKKLTAGHVVMAFFISRSAGYYLSIHIQKLDVLVKVHVQ